MAWWKTAKVGDKIVCVEHAYSIERGLGPIRLHREYTISKLYPVASFDSGIGIELSEVERGVYCATNFKPVKPTKADKNLLRKKAAGPKSPVDA